MLPETVSKVTLQEFNSHVRVAVAGFLLEFVDALPNGAHSTLTELFLKNEAVAQQGAFFENHFSVAHCHALCGTQVRGVVHTGGVCSGAFGGFKLSGSRISKASSISRGETIVASSPVAALNVVASSSRASSARALRLNRVASRALSVLLLTCCIEHCGLFVAAESSSAVGALNVALTTVHRHWPATCVRRRRSSRRWHHRASQRFEWRRRRPDDGCIVLGGQRFAWRRRGPSATTVASSWEAAISVVVVAHDDGSIVLGGGDLRGVVVTHDDGGIVVGSCDLSRVVVALADGDIVSGGGDLRASSSPISCARAVFSSPLVDTSCFACEVAELELGPARSFSTLVGFDE